MTTDSHQPIAHLRLDQTLARCPGPTAGLRRAVRSLDTDSAASLCHLLESLLAQSSYSAASGWTRGFATGQQL